MEEIKEKYTNFIKFVSNTIKDNVFVTQLEKLPVEIFLENIKAYGHMNNSEIREIIFNKAGIDMNDYKKEDIIKFQKYLEFFSIVSRLV